MLDAAPEFRLSGALSENLVADEVYDLGEGVFRYLYEGQVDTGILEVTFIEGNPAVVELPSSVVLTVTDAPEGVKGDSTTNVMKTITLETGKKIQAPLFIKNGERLKVDTREGKYMERVNK